MYMKRQPPDLNIGELVNLWVDANDERKQQAVQFLRGEGPVVEDTRPMTLNMKQAAELLGCSRQTLWRLTRNGALPTRPLYQGGAKRIRRSDLEALVQQEG
jgi:excisionase family DNA binding protein